MRSSRALGRAGAALILCAAPGSHRALAAEPGASPALHSGAIELGVAGSMTAVEGVTRATLQVHSGLFFAAGPVLMAVEPEIAWTHVHSLDGMDLDLGVSAHRRLGESALHAYAAAGGGVRQEWLGSFRETRYPVGASLGLRALLDPRAAARIEYRYRRVLDDPVADYSEHVVLVGLSLLFRNAP